MRERAGSIDEGESKTEGKCMRMLCLQSLQVKINESICIFKS